MLPELEMAITGQLSIFFVCAKTGQKLLKFHNHLPNNILVIFQDFTEIQMVSFIICLWSQRILMTGHTLGLHALSHIQFSIALLIHNCECVQFYLITNTLTLVLNNMFE